MSLTMSSIVPLTIYAFTSKPHRRPCLLPPWGGALSCCAASPRPDPQLTPPPPARRAPAVPMPFLPAAPPLGPLFALGTLILLSGLGLFNAPLWMPALTRALKAAAAEEPGGGGAAGLAVAPK